MTYIYDKPDNLVEMFETSVTLHADRPIFGTPDADGNYEWVTYREVGRRVDNLRAGLAGIGVKAEDAVGIIAKNRVEWAVAAFATFGLQARFIPMYEKELTKVWLHILHDGAIKVLLVADRQVSEQIRQMRDQLPKLEHVFVIDGQGKDTMAFLEQQGAAAPVASRRPAPDEIAVLIYTSGTTGNPKGVLLSHGNFTSNVIAGGRCFPELNPESRSLSILPWAHSYGQTAELYNFIHLGASIGFIRDINTIAEDIGIVAPTFLIAVPRVFNRIYDGLWKKIEQSGGLARKLFLMGLESAEEIRRRQAEGKSALGPRMKFRIADSIVFSKIRRRFGGRLKGALTASAMMNPKVARFFTDIGLPVFDAYGLTETSPAVTMNSMEANRPGSVGRPIDKVKVDIDHSKARDNQDEGEVIVYGPNVMQGYHNNPGATRAVMTEDGGFRTGDMGRLDDDGFLYITGRIKEQYKLENGKYVFPASLEEEIQLIPWVENVMVYGEGRHTNLCLIVPEFLQFKDFLSAKGLQEDPRRHPDNPKVLSLVAETVAEHLGGKFRGYEIPRKFLLAEEPFSVENGMLTQTLKLKRRKVFEKYAGRIEAAYTKD